MSGKAAGNFPAYEMNGVEVPEQHLNDTEMIPISNGVYIDQFKKENKIGLMQGFLTLPFNERIKVILKLRFWYDLDTQ